MSKDDYKSMTHRCSFCGKPSDRVEKLIAGPASVFICNECVALCESILEEDLPTEGKQSAPLENLPTPVEMKAILDEYVIGQDQAKKALCVAVYNHYKRISRNTAKATGRKK